MYAKIGGIDAIMTNVLGTIFRYHTKINRQLNTSSKQIIL